MRRISRKTYIASLLLTTVFASTALSQTRVDASRTPAISGYSPVSYFTEGAAERGTPEFAVEHENSVYFLTSDEQVELFYRNPDKYRPRHKSCPYSLAFGMVLPLDPTNFKIVGGSLLLFHLSEEKDALLLWNTSDISERELLRRADANNLFEVDF